MRPNTRFTWSGGFGIAYQVLGDGVRDLVYLPGYVSNVDTSWDVPPIARFLEGLSSFSRLILLDRRGVGCSDRYMPGASPPLEEMADDVLAVMDAVGSTSATLFGIQDTAFIAMMLAASAPKRVGSLVLFGAAAAWQRNEEMPWAASSEEWDEVIKESSIVESALERADYYTRDNLPSLAGDPTFVQRFASLILTNQAPAAYTAEFQRLRQADVRGILSSIQAPTLILHRTKDPVEPIESGRHLARRIPRARLVELDGSDTQPWAGGADAVLAEVEAFITGSARRVPEDPAREERMLATVLFTDIVGSTATAAEMGDETWRALIAEHDRTAKTIIARFRGTYVRGTGDGLLATFDGPARGVRCAEALIEAMKPLGIEVRAGLHTGEIGYGGNDLAGIGVHIGARVGAMAGPCEVWVTSTVKDLVAGSGLTFEDAGEHELKGVPDRWRLFRVVDP